MPSKSCFSDIALLDLDLLFILLKKIDCFLIANTYIVLNVFLLMVTFAVISKLKKIV